MAKKEQPWKDNWELVKELPGGGQCTNYIVKPGNGNTGLYVLKVIKDQTNKERRIRFYREVHNYISLNHPNIPKIVDHNCNESPEGENRLFFVYPFVEGQNLEEFIQGKGRLTLSDSINLLIQLSNILDFIHHNDVIHRDFKPDNIILSHENIADPVLIDFGLSVALEDDHLKESGEKQLGNRFLYLPELKYDSGNKRDKRSDITYLVGILFFVLTGESPSQLLDEKERYPHQRVDLTRLIPEANSHQISLLKRLFDIGFQHQINSRFQSIEHLKESLRRILKVEKKDEFNFEEFLKNSSDPSLLKVYEILNNMYPAFIKLFSNISSKIGKNIIGLEVGLSGPSVLPHVRPMCISGHIYVTEKFERTIKETYQVKLYPNGNEYILAVMVNNEELFIERFQNIENLDMEDVLQESYNAILKHFAQTKTKL